MKILFSEGSSLSAREFLNVLGPRGHWIEVLDPSPGCICRFSRWTRKIHPCPPSGKDPLSYLATVNRLLADGSYDVLLPTHEQAWLFSVAGEKLNKNAGIAVAPPDSFARVQSKIAFAQLLDETGLPQPEWEIVDSIRTLRLRQPPFYLKTPYSTAGTGVRLVKNRDEAEETFHFFRQTTDDHSIMLQEAGTGKYAQVQALFDHGRLVAAHTSIQTAVGIGPSAAGRMSVSHEFARDDIALLGRYLNWHGGLTLDYLFQDGERSYIECNPRTVEPANAVAGGVDLPGLQLAVSIGEHPPEVPPGRAGVGTHSALAIILGKAAYAGTRKDVFRQVTRLLFAKGEMKDSRETLTPIAEDMPSLAPLIAVTAQALFSPRSVLRLSKTAIDRYSVTSAAVKKLIDS